MTRRLREDHKGKENTLEDTARYSTQGRKVKQIEKEMEISFGSKPQSRT